MTKSSVIFVGDRIGFTERKTRSGVVLLDRFRVIQAFHGVPSGVSEYWVRYSDVVRTLGERNLIEAERYEDTFQSPTPDLFDVLLPATCGYTGPADMPHIRRTISQLQAWARSVRKTGVTGGVFENARTRYWKGWPVPEADVTLSGQGVTRQARTRSDGVFSFFNLLPGNYRIQARREGLQPEKEYEEITVPQIGCAYVETILKSKTEVHLRTVFANGRVAPNTSLLLDHPSYRSAYKVKTDSNGKLNLIELNTGTYSVALASSRRKLGTLTVRPGGNTTEATFVVDRYKP